MYPIIKFSTLLILFSCATFMGCESSSTSQDKVPDKIRLGLNLELTGTYADVGETSKNVVNIFEQEVIDEGGILIGDKKYPVSFQLFDSKSTVEGAEQAVERLDDENVLIILGPNISNLAIPAGATAENTKIPLISPWSTNPGTTADRTWVFRAGYVDTYQDLVLAQFASDQLNATKAAVLYADDNAYPRGLAENFKMAWEDLHGAGSVVAFETFTTGDQDLGDQLSHIAGSGAGFLFLPQYAQEVPVIVRQAHQAGITVPILGADSWEGGNLIQECGEDCNGYYYTKHFIASAATGKAKMFVDKYKSMYGKEPDDIAALTWDALLIIKQALMNCELLATDTETNRRCILEGMKAITGLKGITGTYDFTGHNDPVKCVPIVQIQNGELSFVEQVCP